MDELDPVIVFLAGAFVGATIGPQVVTIAKGMIASRSNEIAQVLVDRFIGALAGPTLPNSNAENRVGNII